MAIAGNLIYQRNILWTKKYCSVIKYLLYTWEPRGTSSIIELGVLEEQILE